MYSKQFDNLLNKSIAVKRSTLESLLLYHSTVTYASVVKGNTKPNINDDNVSIMTELSNDKNVKNNATNTKDTERNTEKNKKNNKEDSMLNDDQSSVWSKESVVKQIKTLSEELAYEKRARELEKQERIKEKEENKIIIEGIQ